MIGIGREPTKGAIRSSNMRQERGAATDATCRFGLPATVQSRRSRRESLAHCRERPFGACLAKHDQNRAQKSSKRLKTRPFTHARLLKRPMAVKTSWDFTKASTSGDFQTRSFRQCCHSACPETRGNCNRASSQRLAMMGGVRRALGFLQPLKQLDRPNHSGANGAARKRSLMSRSFNKSRRL